jgi:hypothetical protein
MQDIHTKDETITSGPQLRLPAQVQPVARTPLTTGTISGTEGIDPQVHVNCDEFGRCSIIGPD